MLVVIAIVLFIVMSSMFTWAALKGALEGSVKAAEELGITQELQEWQDGADAWHGVIVTRWNGTSLAVYNEVRYGTWRFSWRMSFYRWYLSMGGIVVRRRHKEYDIVARNIAKGYYDGNRRWHRGTWSMGQGFAELLGSKPVTHTYDENGLQVG